MAAKIIGAILILTAIFFGMLVGTGEFADTVEELISQTADIITAPDISEGIEIFYSFEENFYEAETFISLFVNDSLLEDIREDMVEIRTAFFNGERDDAILFASLLRERLLQIHRSVQPSVANIL